MRASFVLAALMMVVSACSSGDVSATEAAPSTPTTVPTVEESAVEAEPTTTTTAVATTTTTTTTSSPSATTTSISEDSASECRRIVDFAAPEADWFIVNDGVMGGLSEGGGGIADGVLSFNGVINTNGGGFSSVRTTVPEVAFADTTSMRIRYRSAFARSYEFIVDVDAPDLDRRVSYFGQIDADGTTDVQEAEVAFADFESRIFGTLVSAPPIDPAQIRGIGIILSDGIDGDFAMEVEWIDACGVSP